MRFEDFTPGQQKAIISDGSNIIVSAGAGSGKTAVLTERVLYFIKNKGYNINDFIILTFTELAAGEMKERIRKTLTNEDLIESNNVDTAQISTFDAYALSLVKKHHQYLNVSKDISLIDSSIISVKKRNIINEIFEEYYDNNEIFSRMIQEYCYKDDDDLVELVYELMEKSSLEIDSQDYLDNFIANYFNDSFIKSIKVKVLEKLINDAHNLILQLDSFKTIYNYPISNKDERIYSQLIYELFDKIRSLIYENGSEIININNDNVDELYDQLFMCFNIELPSIKTNNFDDEEYKKAKEDIKEKIKKHKEKLGSYPQNYNEFQEYFYSVESYTSLLIEIVNEAFKRLNKYKEEKQVFEFQDVAKMALSLVKDNEYVRNSIKETTKMIMIDEYQDTSLLQDTFISYIANNNIYMVGDIKQSIYRFRNARSDLFLAKYNKYKNNNGGIAIDLNTNFRSRSEVLEDINYMFSAIMSEKMGGANYLKDHMIEAGNKNYDLAGLTNTSHNSDILICSQDIDDSSNIKDFAASKEAKAVALDIIDKVKNHYQVLDTSSKTPKLRDCTYSDFCILADRGTEFDKFVETFNEYKVPLFVENDENISNSEIVAILTNILRLVKIIQNNDYKNQELIHPFISLARSFIYQYDDAKLLELANSNDENNSAYLNDPIMVKLIEIVESNPNAIVSDLFSKIVFELNLYNSLIRIGDVAKYERYLDLFIENFKTMSKLGYNIDDFLLYLKNINEYNLKFTLTSSKSSIDSVKIMNIHKSKGLEFPIVYFVILDKSFNRMELNKKFGISKRYGIYFDRGEHKANFIKDLNGEYEANEDDSEKIRLFYVALTRTREKMIFVVNGDEKYNELLKIEADSILKNLENSCQIQDAYMDLLNKYQNNEINFNVFEKCIHILGYTFSSYFLSVSKSERCNINVIDALLELKVAMILQELEVYGEDMMLVCKYLSDKYLKKEIDTKILKIIVKDLGYELLETFKNDEQNLFNHLVPSNEKIISKLLEKYQNESLENIYNELVNDLDVSISRKVFELFFENLGYLIAINGFEKLSKDNLLKLGANIVLAKTTALIIKELLEYYQNEPIENIYQGMIEKLDVEISFPVFKEFFSKLGYVVNPKLVYLSREERLKAPCNEYLVSEEKYKKELESIPDYSQIKEIFFSYILELIGANASKYKITSINNILNLFNCSLSVMGENIINYIKESKISINSLKNYIDIKDKNELQISINDYSLLLIIRALKYRDIKVYNDNYFFNTFLSEEENKALFEEYLKFTKQNNGDISFKEFLEIIIEKIERNEYLNAEIINKINYLVRIKDIFSLYEMEVIDDDLFLQYYLNKNEKVGLSYDQIFDKCNHLYNDKRISLDELNIINQYLNRDLICILKSGYLKHSHYNLFLKQVGMDEGLNSYYGDCFSIKECSKANYWFKLLLDKYLNKEITFDYLIKLFESHNYLLVHKLFLLSSDEVADLTISKLQSYMLKFKENLNVTFTNFMNLFYLVTSPLYTYRISDSLTNPLPAKKNEINEVKHFTVKHIDIHPKVIERRKASKDIDLNVDTQALEFGNKIHFVMEVIDFTNPNYDLIPSKFEKNIVKRFLDSKLMEKVKNGKVYKEFEFYDEKTNTSGIIDLMIVYEEHIDIIDYKTKNINNEAYNEQLKIYSDYIRARFNKKINAYLYSLLTGNQAQIIKD